MRFSYIVLSLLLGLATGCSSPVAESHIEGNVPKGKLFDDYLVRDLNRYFCGDVEDCRVEYEFLREGPTQSGIAYPKYYLWVKSLKGGNVRAEGAVRVAAVEQQGFDVTQFLSSAQIEESPSEVASVFPAALVEKIIDKARKAQLQEKKTKAKAAQ